MDLDSNDYMYLGVILLLVVVTSAYFLYDSDPVKWVFDSYRGVWVRTDTDCLSQRGFQGVTTSCVGYPCIEDCWETGGIEDCGSEMNVRTAPNGRTVYCVQQNCQPVPKTGGCEVLCTPC